MYQAFGCDLNMTTAGMGYADLAQINSANSRFIDPNAFPDPFFPIVCPYCSTTSSHADIPRVATD